MTKGLFTVKVMYLLKIIRLKKYLLIINAKMYQFWHMHTDET